MRVWYNHIHSTAASAYAVLGFFVPYLDREVIRLPTPPYDLLASSFPLTLAAVCLTRSNAPLTKWYLTPGQSCARPPRTMTTECCCTLCPNHWLVFLPVDSTPLFHTFPWDIGRNDLARTQSDPRNLPLARVGFLRLRRSHFQTYALQLRPIPQLWRSEFSRLLRYPPLSQDLY